MGMGLTGIGIDIVLSTLGAGAGFVGVCAISKGEFAQSSMSPNSRLAKTMEKRIVMHPCTDLTDFIVPPGVCSRSFPLKNL
jgi:hypothetical protein